MAVIRVIAGIKELVASEPVCSFAYYGGEELIIENPAEPIVVKAIEMIGEMIGAYVNKCGIGMKNGGIIIKMVFGYSGAPISQYTSIALGQHRWNSITGFPCYDVLNAAVELCVSVGVECLTTKQHFGPGWENILNWLTPVNNQYPSPEVMISGGLMEPILEFTSIFPDGSTASALIDRIAFVRATESMRPYMAAAGTALLGPMGNGFWGLTTHGVILTNTYVEGPRMAHEILNVMPADGPFTITCMDGHVIDVYLGEDEEEDC